MIFIINKKNLSKFKMIIFKQIQINLEKMVKINKLLNLMMMMIMRTLLINAVIKTVILVLWIHITKKKTSRTIIENNIFI